MDNDSYNSDKEDPPKEPVDFKRRLRQLSVDLWIWEVASLSLSAMCVGAILVILVRYDDKPLPTWIYGLTINGVISVLAVIAKASMILPVAEAISQLKWHWYWRHSRPVLDFHFLDAASRGPWGCFVLLFRPRQWSVATIGALITVASLLMEPSLQLIPSYHDGFVDVGTASLPRATYYQDYNAYHAQNGNSAQTTYNIGIGAKESFYGAMFSSASNRSITLSPTCPTGNCTWPSFSSLAVCSTCLNVTSDVYFSGKHASEEHQAYTWYLGDVYQVGSGQLAYAWNTARPVSSSQNFSSTSNQTFFQMLYMRQVKLPGGFYSKPEAHQCVMFMCVKTFEASMREGIFDQQVTSSWPSLYDFLPEQPSFYDGSISTWHPSQVEVKIYTIKSPGEDITYAADTFSVVLLQQWLSGMANSLTYSSDQLRGYFSSEDMGQFFYDAQGTDQYSGPGPAMERIADGLTSYIRNKAHSDSEVQGSAHGIQTIVHARWFWSILPIALVCLTFAFMASTIALSVHNGVPVWKSSSLAVMVHGLSDEVSSRVSATKLDVMESHAEDYTMVMAAEQRQWRLKGVLRQQHVSLDQQLFRYVDIRTNLHDPQRQGYDRLEESIRQTSLLRNCCHEP